MHRFASALMGAALLIVPIAATAQDAVDHAGNYATGPLTSLDQGTGWDPVPLTITPSNGTATASVGLATSAGGHANMDVSNQSWILETSVPGTDTFNAPTVSFSRDLGGAVPHQAGEQLLFWIQGTPASVAGSFSVSVMTDSIVNLTVFTINPSGNWRMSDVSQYVNTTIPVTTPQEILITNDGATINVQFRNLINNDIENFNFAPINQGDIARITVANLILDSSSPDSQTVIVNNMKFEDAGTLPVELDQFVID